MQIKLCVYRSNDDIIKRKISTHRSEGRGREWKIWRVKNNNTAFQIHLLDIYAGHGQRSFV